MIRSLVCLVVLSTWLMAAPSQAQDDVLVQLYGQGVHDYFAGRQFEAQKSLNAAINAGSRDPRVYYFRGLVNQRLGYEGAAEGDFKMAADLEARTGVSEAVNRALTRIQGQDRMEVEKHRTEARLASHRERVDRRRDRYEDPVPEVGVEDLDDPSLEDDLPVPDEMDDDTAPDLLDEADDAEPVQAPDESDDLFGDDSADDGADEPEADDDLFGDDTTDDGGALDDAADDPADDAGDPFGDDPVEPEDGADAADGDAGDGDAGDAADEIEEDPF